MFFIAFFGVLSGVFQSLIHPFCNLNSEYPQPQETKLYLSGVCPDSFSVFTYGTLKDLLYSTEYKLRTPNIPTNVGKKVDKTCISRSSKLDFSGNY